MERLLTPSEVAEILALPVVSLYGMRHRGQGPPAIRVGRSLRYGADALEEWLDEQRTAEADRLRRMGASR